MILSTKNESAINQKLTQHKLKLPLEKIIGKETLAGYKSKGDFLRDCIDKQGIKKHFFRR